MKDDRPVVLITGASGFIGRHLAPALASNGWNVRTAVRTPAAGPNEVQIKSIGPETDWRDALAGVHAVVHLAARVHAPKDDRAVGLYQSVNVDGTLHLARSAEKLGVRQFVFLSTILVHGRSTDGRAAFKENDVLTPQGIYGRSKAAAEIELEAMAQDGGMCITVVRPPLVYGLGAKGNFRLLINTTRRGIPLPFASIRNRRAFLAVENLASFILDRISRAEKKFDIFLVADEEQVSTADFIRRLAKAAGTTPHLFPVPATVLSALLRMGRQFDARDSLIGNLELDVSKTASTGWRPPFTLDEALRLATRD